MSLRDNPNIITDVSELRRDLDELALAVTSDGSVTTNMLADGAVTSDKVDWTTMTPGWSVFYFSGVHDTETTYTVTTRKGANLTVVVKNGGAGVYVSGGASTILFARVHSRVALNTTITGDYGIQGLTTNSTIWAYYSGMNSGTAVNGNSSYSTGTNNYGSILNITGPKGMTAFSYSALRLTGTVWSIQGQVQSSGSGCSLSYNCEVSATDTGHIPMCYQRGCSSSNLSLANHVIEVFEA